MECKCNNYEYCHHVCGCVSNLSESFGNATMFHNVTKIERDISINETKQILFMGQCLSSTENTINLAVSTTGIDIDGVHNAIYITEEGNRESNTQSREDTTGDPLYGTFEDPCYSTLTLRVNYGPVHSSDGKGSSEDFNPYDLMYEGKGNVARVQESNDNNFYLDKESVQTQISSTQRLYEDPWRNDYSNSLLHHSSQRRFDLMPVDECCSAPRGKEYGPYELASSD
ncbi:uncharacterized protein LOC133196908 [Saccostrea echinata]|uniref:uncharacterized protein LOC133196908 n=1 Tax=Saccostrea echinata TaxID=191078 RepID=UPI002A83CF5A|nr:uncharacterized protein LOC133196908 [Saccostrea echinata]